jgi:hypothetical protein
MISKKPYFWTDFDQTLFLKIPKYCPFFSPNDEKTLVEKYSKVQKWDTCELWYRT